MRTRIVAVLAALSVVLTACGNSGGTEEGGDRTVRVGALPIVPTAAVQLGIDQGFFRERGLDLTLEMSQGGAAMLPAVVAGELDFAIGQPLPLLIANGQGLDVRIVSGYAASKPDGDDINGVFSAEGSGIDRAADLEGKQVAVNTVNAAGDVTIREAVRRDGGDASSVRFVELPFPDMPAALENGNVDAVWVPEPFLTAIRQSGAQLVTYNFQDAVPGLDTLVTFASGTVVEDDAAVVADFAAAMRESLTYAEENPDEVRSTLVDMLDMDADLAERVALETFTADVNVDALRALSDLALTDGLLKAEPDFGSLLLKGD